MTSLKLAVLATLAALAGAVHATPMQAVGLDGTSSPHAARAPSLAASASRALNATDVPSKVGPAGGVKAAADADIAQRSARGPHLKASRENLKEDDAAREIAQRQNAGNYDRNMSMGDKDHTEQVTNLKVYIKK